MLSKQIIAVARSRSGPMMLRNWSKTTTYARTAQFHSSKLLKAETVKVPQMAESITEGTLETWSKQVGDTVAADEEVASIETDKANVSVNSPQSGKIVELLAQEGDTVTVGQDLFRLEPGEAGESGESSAPVSKESEQQPSPSETDSKKDAAEPSDQQVDKKLPEPPAPESSVTERPKPQQGTPKKEDPVSKEPKKESKPKQEKESKKQEKPPAVAGARTETRVKMNRMRLRIAERLKESQNAAASLTTFNEIDMSSLMEMRKKFKDSVEKEHDVKFGFMSAFARASTLALQEIPAANASIEGDEIVYRDFVDLSVAVATPKGLVTPVVRNIEAMGLVQIEKEIASLAKKARDNKLTIEDMAGGTFTISNGGVFGSLYGTPIINLPQSAVLGMHTIKERPVVVNGQIVIRPIMVVALTYDHRLLDGREAVTFLVKVRDYLEDPRKMLLHA